MRWIAVVSLVAGCGRLSFDAVPGPAGDGGSDAAPLTYPLSILASEPFAYYRLNDEGTVAADSSGHNRDAPLRSTLDGTVTTGVAGALVDDDAMRFVGTGVESTNSQAFVDFPEPRTDSAWAALWANAWTIEIFAKVIQKPTTNSYGLVICEDYNDMSPGTGNGFRTGFSTGPQFRFWNVDENGATDIRSPGVDVGDWHQFTVVRTLTDVTMYIDGETANAGALTDYLPPSGPSTACGVGAFTGLPTRVDLDEIAFYDRALTDSEIAAHYAASR